MIGQTIPSTVPEDPPAIVQQFDELAQTGGPSWLFPAVMIALALLLVGAALWAMADSRKGGREEWP